MCIVLLKKQKNKSKKDDPKKTKCMWKRSELELQKYFVLLTLWFFWTSDEKISRVCRMQQADWANRHQAIEHNLTLRVKTMCSVKTRSAETVNFKCT